MVFFILWSLALGKCFLTVSEKKELALKYDYLRSGDTHPKMIYFVTDDKKVEFSLKYLLEITNKSEN